MNNDAEILNGLLNKIGVAGFSFVYEDGYLAIKIPERKDFEYDTYYDYCLIGFWHNLDNLFKFADSHGPAVQGVKYVIRNILDARCKGRLTCYRADYLSINDAGLDFLRCLTNSSSLEELELKLAIRGYCRV